MGMGRIFADIGASLARMVGQAGTFLQGGRSATALTPLSYYDLVVLFPEPGCAICNLLLRDADRYLDGLLYEFALDPYIQDAFRARRGLCNEHSQQITTYFGGSLGVAILYSATLDEVLHIIRQTPPEEPPRSFLARLWNKGNRSSAQLADRLEPVGPCVVCRHLADAERRYVHTMSRYLTDRRLREAYERSDGLCLPHFRQVLRAIQQPEERNLLIAIQQGIWAALKADLDEFIAKNDYQRAAEPMGREKDSWKRATARMAGERGVFGSDLR